MYFHIYEQAEKREVHLPRPQSRSIENPTQVQKHLHWLIQRETKVKRAEKPQAMAIKFLVVVQMNDSGQSNP